MMGAEYPRPEPEVWWKQAACRGQETAWWHPSGKGAEPTAAKNRALAICQTCPVQVECLDYGHAVDSLRDGDSFRYGGIYGGATARQREAIRKRRQLHRSAPRSTWPVADAPRSEAAS